MVVLLIADVRIEHNRSQVYIEGDLVAHTYEDAEGKQRTNYTITQRKWTSSNLSLLYQPHLGRDADYFCSF